MPPLTTFVDAVYLAAIVIQDLITSLPKVKYNTVDLIYHHVFVPSSSSLSSPPHLLSSLEISGETLVHRV